MQRAWRPEHISKPEDAGIAVKGVVGDEYLKYYREPHEKPARYTDWARKRPHK